MTFRGAGSTLVTSTPSSVFWLHLPVICLGLQTVKERITAMSETQPLVGEFLLDRLFSRTHLSLAGQTDKGSLADIQSSILRMVAPNMIPPSR